MLAGMASALPAAAVAAPLTKVENHYLGSDQDA